MPFQKVEYSFPDEEAFLKPPLSLPGRTKSCSRVRHVDGQKDNNIVGNLKWTKIEESCNRKNG